MWLAAPLRTMRKMQLARGGLTEREGAAGEASTQRRTTSNLDGRADGLVTLFEVASCKASFKPEIFHVALGQLICQISLFLGRGGTLLAGARRPCASLHIPSRLLDLKERAVTSSSQAFQEAL